MDYPLVKGKTRRQIVQVLAEKFAKDPITILCAITENTGECVGKQCDDCVLYVPSRAPETKMLETFIKGE